MRVAVVGGGAVGTLLGAHFCPGMTVSVIDRGARLRDLRAHGLRLLCTDGEEVQRVPDVLTDDFREAGTQDHVILAV